MESITEVRSKLNHEIVMAFLAARPDNRNLDSSNYTLLTLVFRGYIFYQAHSVKYSSNHTDLIIYDFNLSLK
jgi:hypothetical protein